jgi:iron complex transport system substrate-binding protein
MSRAVRRPRRPAAAAGAAAAAAVLGMLAATIGHAQAAAPPRRVVSLAPSLTELVFALGAGDTLAGVTVNCDYPPAAKQLPKVGGLEDGSINLERVLGLRPQLVIAIGEGQHQTVESLRRLGLTVEVVPSQSVDDVFRAAVRLGTLLGREVAAQRLVADLERRMARVEKVVATVPPERRPRVFYELWDRPLMTATRSSVIGRLIEMAGGVNVFGALPGRYPQVSPEAVLERRPQIIVAPDHHGSAVDFRGLAERLGLSAAEPSLRERILILDGDLVSRAGPRIAGALELLARSFHPDLFPAAAPGGPGRR